MSKIKGTVTGMGKSQYSYFIKLDGNDFYYNTKFEPKCTEGAIVGIEFEQKAENRGQIKKVTILQAGPPAEKSEWDDTPPASKQPYRKPTGGGDRQDSIVWQHSQEMAIRTAGVLLTNAAFSVKGTIDAKRLQVEGLIDELTARYFNDAMNPRKSAAFTTAAEIDSDLDEGSDTGFDSDSETTGEWGEFEN